MQLGNLAGSAMKSAHLYLILLSSFVAASSAHAQARFRSPSLYALPASPVAAIADDFDGDGSLDVASAASNGHVVVLLGRGDGTLQSPLSTPIAATSPNVVNGIAALDVDADGQRDLVVSVAPTPQSCAAVVLRGRGDGTFVAGATLPIEPEPDAWNYGCSAVLAEDLNRDGNTDIVLAFGFIAGQASPPLRTGFNVFSGRGDGSFELTLSAELDADQSSLAITTGDFDSDGDLDLVLGEDVVYLSGPREHDVVTLLGDGSGVFPTQSSQDATDAIGFARFQGVNAGDFDGDGALDVALIANLDGFGDLPGSPKNAITLHGHGDGSFDPPVIFASTAGANSVASADFDGDGSLDLAIASFTDAGGGASVFRGEGDGSFAAPLTVALSAAPQCLIAADFNDDGKVDLAAVDASANVVAIVLNDSRRRHRRCFPRY